MSSKMVTGSSSLEPVVHGLATFSFAQPAIYNTYLRFSRWIPNRHQCSRFPGPLARQTRGADRYQQMLRFPKHPRPLYARQRRRSRAAEGAAWGARV